MKSNLLINSINRMSSESSVRFLNLSSRNVDLIWFNSQYRVKYKTLGPKQHIDVNTYSSDSWIFTDSITRDLMSGQLYKNLNQLNDNQYKPLICIRLPLLSLKERCFQVLKHQLLNNESIDFLQIPESLINDLRFYCNKSSFR
jgi:hypothetical protein